MPQFDTFSFFSQITWMFFIFCWLILICNYIFLPAISITLKTRYLKIWLNNLSQSKKTNLGNFYLENISKLLLLNKGPWNIKDENIFFKTNKNFFKTFIKGNFN